MQIFSPRRSNGDYSQSSPRKKINWKKIGKIALWTMSGMLLIMVGIFAYIAKDLPSPGGLNKRVIIESTKIYDRTGEHLLYEVHGEEKRTQIQFSEIPDAVKYATISLEDQNFYNHYGVDIKSVLRAVFKDVIKFGAAQGGSTITQQLIKNSMLSSERTLVRKAKEVILSVELEQKFSKDEILGMYLNEIPYGSNAYGIEAAAQTFFGKNAKELTLAQSALLASLPQAPTYFSPYGSHPEDLKARQEYALKQMAKFGYITEDQANEAKNEDVLSSINPFRENINAPHFVMFIKEYLESKYGEQTIEQGGLKVITTLDWDKQTAAQQSVRDGAAKNVARKASNAALVAMDPKTGQILAMVGSKDYFDQSIDGQVNVAIRDRQPGSSFKPYVYLTAFEKGFTPETQLWDVDTNFSTDNGQTYDPKNYDGENHGLLQMKNTLAMSLNVPAVKTLYLAGVKNSIETAKKMGITSLNNPDRYGLSLVLGGGEVTLLDHTNAFSTLATGGIHHNQVSVLKVEDNHGDILEQYTPGQGNRVVDEKYVAMIDYIISTNDLRAPVFGDNNPLKFTDRPVAAKTGTTNEWRDGWTMGYTPSLAVGVWAGNNDNSPMAQGADGIFVAAPIFRSFMDQSLKNSSAEQFPKYEKEDTGKDVLDGNLKEKNNELEVCQIPGKDKYCLANNDACPSSLIEKKKFSNIHDILYYVNKDDPRGDAPKNPGDDPQFKNWEKAVQNYVNKDKKSKDAPPEDSCNAKDFKDIDPEVKITAPSNGETITSSTISISVSVSSPFDIKKVSLEIDGSEVTSNTGSFSYNYSVPSDKYASDINIKATAIDENGNSASKSMAIHTNILITP